MEIPKIIWQTYKTKKLPKQAEECHSTWKVKKHGWLERCLIRR